MFSPSSLPPLEGQIFIVTGGNTGIGYVTCLNLVAHGARVYMGARSSEKAKAAMAQIKESYPKADLHLLLLDHTSLASVVAAAERFKSQEAQLNGLILNGGIMAVSYELTEDGYEIQFQVNYLAHWVMTSHLLPVLLSTAKTSGSGAARIVYVSSEGHNSFGVKGMIYDAEDVKNFGDYGRYGLSKLANVLHAKTLNNLYGPGSSSAEAGKGEIWTASLHPGFINTQLNEKNRDQASWKLSWIHPVLNFLGIMRPWEEGCISSLFVAASPEFTADMSGKYLDQKAQVKQPNVAAEDVTERERLEKWTVERMKAGGWI